MAKCRTLVGWLGNAILWLLVALAVFLVVTTGIFKWQYKTVVSGSMDPAIEVGGMVVALPANPQSLESGDIITYYSPEYRQPLVHRIVEKHEGGQVYFSTKGDANGARDAYLLPAQDVQGKVSLYVPLLGYVPHFFRSASGLILIIAVPGLVIVWSELRKVWVEVVRIRQMATDGEGSVGGGGQWSSGLRREDWVPRSPVARSP